MSAARFLTWRDVAMRGLRSPQASAPPCSLLPSASLGQVAVKNMVWRFRGILSEPQPIQAIQVATFSRHVHLCASDTLPWHRDPNLAKSSLSPHNTKSATCTTISHAKSADWCPRQDLPNLRFETSEEQGKRIFLATKKHRNCVVETAGRLNARPVAKNSWSQ